MTVEIFAGHRVGTRKGRIITITTTITITIIIILKLCPFLFLTFPCIPPVVAAGSLSAGTPPTTFALQ
jgi:hypothetical protein